MHLSFGVAGTDRRIRLGARLDYVRDDETPMVQWRLNVPAQDPWAEADEYEVDSWQGPGPRGEPSSTLAGDLLGRSGLQAGH